MGYIKSDGYVTDRYYNRIGVIVSDGEVKDRSLNKIGFIARDGELKDLNYDRIGFMKSDGELKDRSLNRIGYIKNYDSGTTNEVFGIDMRAVLCFSILNCMKNKFIYFIFIED